MPDATTSFTRDIPERIAKNPERARQIGATFVFRITGEGGGTWSIALQDDPRVIEGEAEGADCILTMTHDAWREISDHPARAMNHFTSGVVQVTGNAMLAIKLPAIIG
ncbi:MAG: SCP2 sterol-binding domain-containing protein [Polyangiales bacterium]|nr:SCP2 sterol-binding domain-containing protein [Myxococcales bacterium]MCB9658028.1 SCP2 sterol-binding domain-containing protein [Sandaracinaceae bacterium]